MELVEIKCRCKDCIYSKKPGLFRHCYYRAGDPPEKDPEMYPMVEEEDFCNYGRTSEDEEDGD